MNSEFKQYTMPQPTFDAFNPEANTQAALGSDRTRSIQEGGVLQSNNYVKSTSGYRISPDTVEFNEGITVASLDIPDTTTANSMHVETDGDTYWGVNVASGFSSALASISKAGVATFKNVLIGGANLVYQVTNAGIFSFGDGSDGALTTTGNVTLTSDKYYTTLTVATEHTVNPAGYRIFCSTSLTLEGTGKIALNGNTGTVGTVGGSPDTSGNNKSGGAGGGGGAALADGYLKGAVVGGAGGAGSAGTGGGSSPIAATAGTAGGNTSNSIGSNGVAGGAGANTTGPGNALGGSGGTATASNVKLIANWHLATMLDISSTGSTVKFDNSAAGGGGGGGTGGLGTGSSPNNAFGGGGGGGGGAATSGGIITIYAKTLTIGASASITANGGVGGAGGAGGNANGNGSGDGGGGNGGGGGGGGNGGQIVLVYNVLTNSGTLSASAGVGGAGGAGGAKFNSGTVGQTGSSGTTGNAGTIRQFEVSL